MNPIVTAADRRLALAYLREGYHGYVLSPVTHAKNRIRTRRRMMRSHRGSWKHIGPIYGMPPYEGWEASTPHPI